MLRWISVLPAAVIGLLATRVITTAVMLLAMNAGLVVPDARSGVFYWLRLFALYTVKQAAFVVAGAMTAPRYRTATTIVLTAIAILFSFVVHIFVQLHPGSTNYTHVAFESAGSVGGVAYIFYSELKQQRKHGREDRDPNTLVD